MSFIFDLLFEFDGDVFKNDVLEFFYIGLYEWEMELEFENLIELYRQICDFDDWLMEIGSFIRIGFSDEEVELVQELNIWMLFILFNIVFFFESFESSFLVFEFDIVNYNIYVIMVYGNLIFFDNLVFMLSRLCKVIECFDV